MIGIIMEGALFVALIATVAALLFYALFRWTPLGLRLRQDRNRRQIEHTLVLECPIHALQREEETVRMPSGFQAQAIPSRPPGAPRRSSRRPRRSPRPTGC